MDEEKDELNKYLSNPLEYRPDFQAEERERTAWELRTKEEETTIPIHKNPPGLGIGELTETIKEFERVKEDFNEKIYELQKKLERQTIPTSPGHESYIEEAKKELGLKEGPLNIKDYIAALNSNSPAGAYLVDYIEKWSEGPEGNIEWELIPDLVEARREIELVDKYIEQIIYSIIGFKKDGEDWEEDLLKNEKEWGDELRTISNHQLDKKEAYKKALLYSPNLILASRGHLHESDKDFNEKRFEFSQIKNALIVVNDKRLGSERILNSVNYLIEEESSFGGLEKDLNKLIEDLPEEMKNYEHLQILLHLSIDKDNRAKGKLKNNLRTVYSIETQDRLLEELSGHQEVYRKDTLPMLHYLRGYQSEVSPEASQLFVKLTEGMKENNKHREDKMHQFFLTNRATSLLREEKILNTQEKEISRQGYQFAKKKYEEG